MKELVDFHLGKDEVCPGLLALRSQLFATIAHTFMAAAESNNEPYVPSSDVSTLQWLKGMMIASVFSLVYLFTPMYMLASTTCLLLRYPSTTWSIAIAFPMLLSILIKPITCPWIVQRLTPMLDYFQYEEIIEHKSVNARQELVKGRRNYILTVQPHGVISFGGLCSAVAAPPEFQGRLKTAVAWALLHTPILKHVLGIFGLTDASKQNVIKILSQKGIDGSIVLYIGGIAELFMSSRKEEKLFLSKRKGFIKLALTQGVDVVPIYFFGNTSVLTVVKTGLLGRLSRKLQVSLTYFWGKYYLPIPRDDKVRDVKECVRASL